MNPKHFFLIAHLINLALSASANLSLKELADLYEAISLFLPGQPGLRALEISAILRAGATAEERFIRLKAEQMEQFRAMSQQFKELFSAENLPSLLSVAGHTNPDNPT